MLQNPLNQKTGAYRGNKKTKRNSVANPARHILDPYLTTEKGNDT
jgi:hypothetical protein